MLFRSQEARECLAELAAEDLARVADAQGLRVASWQRLSTPRRSNVLRAWLATALDAAAPASLVQRLLHELPGAGPAAWLVGGVTLRRHRGRLSCASTPAVSSPEPPPVELRLLGPGRYELPGWGGHLLVERVREGGVAASALACVQIGRAHV